MRALSADPSAVPLRVAADRLGISRHAVRQRIRRGTLQAFTRDGRWYVYVGEADTSADPSGRISRIGPADPSTERIADGSADTSGDLRALVTTVQEENRRLYTQLEARAREVQELHVLLQQAQTMRSLPAPSSTTEPPTAPRRRSWRPSWLWLWRWPSKEPPR